MSNDAAGSKGRRGARYLAPDVSGSNRDRRLLPTAIAGALAGVLAIGACVTMTSGASALSIGQSTAGASLMAATSSEVNLPAWPVLRQGSNAGWPAVTVRSLQYLLDAHGAGLGVDGVFGPQTEAVVRAFQQNNGLAVDGVVGEQTWSALIVTVSYGSAGEAVEVVQDQANYRILTPDGMPVLQIDGIFGPRTDEWVRQFQTIVAISEPMPVDGIVGPLTWRALIGGMLAE